MLNIFDSELSEQQFISMFTWCYNNLKIKKMRDLKKKKKQKENLLLFQLQKSGITFAVNFRSILYLLPHVFQSTEYQQADN